MGVGRCRHDDHVEEPGLDHLRGVGEGLRIRSELQGCRHPIRIDVADGCQLQPLRRLDSKVVLVTDRSIRQQAHTHDCDATEGSPPQPVRVRNGESDQSRDWPLSLPLIVGVFGASRLLPSPLHGERDHSRSRSSSG